MANQARWVVVALFLGGVATAAEPATGFQQERRVRQSTTLDWDFAAPKGARLPREHDSRRVRYQLFVPETYRKSQAWPLILAVSPGDAPLAWRHWSGLCEKNEVLFCEAYGAGNHCPEAQRFRILCDVLDDVRRDYRIDPDRTYLAGTDSGAGVAFRLAAALPETFGGVVLLNGDGPLPPLDHEVRRLTQRLSVAASCGDKEQGRRRVEAYFVPLLSAIDVRSKLWLADAKEGEPPPAATLEAAYAWLEKDLERRQDDTKRHGGSGLDLAAKVLRQADEESKETKTLFAAAAKLNWIIERYSETAGAHKAKQLLDEIEKDEGKKRELTAQREDCRRVVVVAQARGLERSGRLAEARSAWLEAAQLGPEPRRKRSLTEAERLAGVLARGPYLGLTFAGETTLVKAAAAGGPAHLAGVRVGDRVEKVGATEVDSPAAVRKLLAAKKPGEELVLSVRRGKEAVEVRVVVGAVPLE